MPKFDYYYEHIQELLENDSREDAFDMLRQTDLIRRNFLQINVHFSDRKITIYQEKAFLTVAGKWIYSFKHFQLK